MSSAMPAMYCSNSDKVPPDQYRGGSQSISVLREPRSLPLAVLIQPFNNHGIRFARDFVRGVEEPQFDRPGATAKRFGVPPHPVRRVILVAFGGDVQHVDDARLVFAFGLPIAGNAAADRDRTANQVAVRERESKVGAGGLRKSE